MSRHPIIAALLALPLAQSASLPILAKSREVKPDVVGISEDDWGQVGYTEAELSPEQVERATNGQDDPVLILIRLAREAIHSDIDLHARSRKAIERCFDLRPIPCPRPPVGF